MLTLNTSLKSKSGKEITILKHIGSGGQSDVYAVSDNSETLKALKWFRRDDEKY